MVLKFAFRDLRNFVLPSLLMDSHASLAFGWEGKMPGGMGNPAESFSWKSKLWCWNKNSRELSGKLVCIMTRENSIAVVASLSVHSWGEGVSWGVDFSGLKKKKKKVGTYFLGKKRTWQEGCVSSNSYFWSKEQVITSNTWYREEFKASAGALRAACRCTRGWRSASC